MLYPGRGEINIGVCMWYIRIILCCALLDRSPLYSAMNTLYIPRVRPIHTKATRFPPRRTTWGYPVLREHTRSGAPEGAQLLDLDPTVTGELPQGAPDALFSRHGSENDRCWLFVGGRRDEEEDEKEMDCSQSHGWAWARASPVCLIHPLADRPNGSSQISKILQLHTLHY